MVNGPEHRPRRSDKDMRLIRDPDKSLAGEAVQIGRAARLLMNAIETVRATDSVAGRPYIVAVSGEPGVGKSTLTKAVSKLYEEAGAACQTISADGYYQQPVREGLTTVRESTQGQSVGPLEWDIDDLQRDLRSYQSGNTVFVREMDWNTCAVSVRPIVPTADILIVDHLLAHLLTTDLAIRLTADPQRILDQAQARDSREQRTTQNTPLLQIVRERERLLISNLWDTILHPKQLAMHDYESVAVESSASPVSQDTRGKIDILANLDFLGSTSRQRIIEKLRLLEQPIDAEYSYAELLWIESGLRLLPQSTADTFREHITSDARYATIPGLSGYLLTELSEVS